MLKYIKNELKPKEQNKYMNTLKNLDAILHEQLLEIIDSQIFNGASILNAIKICNELKRNLQDFHNAAYAGEKYDFGASAFNVGFIIASLRGKKLTPKRKCLSGVSIIIRSQKRK